MSIEEIVNYFSAKPGITDVATAGKRVIFWREGKMINIFLRPTLLTLRLNEVDDYEYDPGESNVLNLVWDRIISTS